MNANHRISGGEGNRERCENCSHLTPDMKHPGWGWCSLPANRVMPSDGWPEGFTPSQSPSGTCDAWQARAALKEAPGGGQ